MSSLSSPTTPSATRFSSARWRSTMRLRISAARRLSTSSCWVAGSNCLTLFQVVFMETAGYIIVGAICERITFWAFLLCELFMGALLSPIFGGWAWGGGWLSLLGSSMNLGHGYVD